MGLDGIYSILTYVSSIAGVVFKLILPIALVGIVLWFLITGPVSQVLFFGYSLTFASSLLGAILFPLVVCINALIRMYASDEYSYIWSVAEEWSLYISKLCAGALLLHCIWWLCSCVYVAYDAVLLNKTQNLLITVGVYVFVSIIAIASVIAIKYSVA